METLTGRTALVTGAGRRIGRALVLALAREGVDVIVHSRAGGRDAEETAAAVCALGVKAWTLQGDLADTKRAELLFDEAVALAGPIDYLVNNASSFLPDRLGDVTVESLHGAVDLNALTPFLLGRRMARQERPGCIVNLLDARVADYDREHVSYHLSKRMLLTLTRMMAVEFAPRIRVSAVAPGLILPPAGKDESYLAELASTNPLHRHGRPEDVAEAMVYLLRSDFITGQVLFVDGGRHMKGNMYGY